MQDLPLELLSLVADKCEPADRYGLRLTCKRTRLATHLDGDLECLVSMLHFVRARRHAMVLLRFGSARDTFRVYPCSCGLFYLRTAAPGLGATTYQLVRSTFPRLTVQQVLDMVAPRRADLAEGVFYKLRSCGLRVYGHGQTAHRFTGSRVHGFTGSRVHGFTSAE